MNWDDIKLALTIARSGSLSRAAIALDINQSTVGRRLNALEASLGVPIFLRSKQGLRLTDRGEIFIAKAAAIESQAENLLESVKVANEEVAGTLRLLGNQWMINQLIRSGLGNLLQNHPDLRIRTISGRPEESLWRGEPGIGLWFETTPVDGAFQITLGKIGYALYKLKDGGGTGRVSFYDERKPINRAGEYEPAFNKEAHQSRLVALDADTLLEAVVQGLGIGLLPICLGSRDPRLERVEPNDDPVERTLYCHIHPDTTNSPRVQVFLSWLRANFDKAFGQVDPVHGLKQN